MNKVLECKRHESKMGLVWGVMEPGGRVQGTGEEKRENDQQK